MKRLRFIFFALLLFIVSFNTLKAQDSTNAEKISFTAGADFYSSYIWRGTKFAGPSVQPSVKMTVGGFTVGVWGSYGIDGSGYTETDPFISYSFPFGLSLGVTDYYFEGDYSELSDTAGNHAFEANLGYTIGGLGLSANYILNEAPGAGSMGGDLYFQITYAFSKVSLFVGAGNGWHTLDNDEGDDVFNISNIGISTSKTIEITEKFSIPVTGQIVVNPDAKRIYAAVGFSF